MKLYHHASISESEVICLPEIVMGLFVLMGGVLSMITGGEVCEVDLFA